MATALLTTYLASDDLIDRIARNVHNSYMQDMKSSFATYPNAFEKAIKSHKIDEYLQKSAAQYFIDSNLDWRQVAILLPDDKLVMWHHYVDNHYIEYGDEEYLVYGTLDTGKLIIDKFFYIKTMSNKSNTNFHEHLNTMASFNHIPFQFVAEHVMNRCVLNAKKIIDMSYHSGKQWENPMAILQWFNSQKW